MPASDAISSLFGNAERFHEAAKKGLWVGVFTALLGLILILLSGVIVVTTTVSPSIGNGDSPALVWLFSKLIGLMVTVVFILPVTYGMRWISNRLSRQSSYAFSYFDPLLSGVLFALGAIGLWYAAMVFQSLNLEGVQTVLGVLLVGGVYLIFAGIGTEVAMAWIFSFTTFALFVKHLHFRAIAKRIVSACSFLWVWMKYPRLWYRYAAATDRTFTGALYALLKEGRQGISEEIATVQPEPNVAQRERPTWLGTHAVTFLLLFLITFVFVLQVRIAGVEATPRAVAEWIFVNHSTEGWAFSPFLHRGVFHYFRNIVLLGFTGYFIEKHVSSGVYLVVVIAVGYVAIGVEAAYLLAVHGGPVMVIGASGMTMVVVTYTGVHLALSHNLVPEIDGFTSWTKTYLGRLRTTPVATVSGSLLYLAMLTGLIYPPFQIINDWSGVISSNTAVAGVAHLFGASCGLLLAVAHSRYTTVGLQDHCIDEVESR